MAEDTDWFAGKQEKQQERCYWRRVGFVLFFAVLLFGFLTLLLYPKKAYADAMVAKQGDESVRLFNKPCKSVPILDQIKPEYHELFRSGEVEVGGKKYSMCWTASNGDVFMVYEDGDKGRVPMSVFTKEMGV